MRPIVSLLLTFLGASSALCGTRLENGFTDDLLVSSVQQPTCIAWAPDGSGIYHFSLRDGMFCLWLQPVDPTTKRSMGEPRPIHHFHNPRLRAGTGAVATTYLAAGYLYMTLTESTANIWLLNRR